MQKKKKKPLAPATRATLRRLGINLLRLRKARRLTQAHVAFRCDMEQNNYQPIEAARINITMDTLTKLALALNVDVADLLAPNH